MADTIKTWYTAFGTQVLPSLLNIYNIYPRLTFLYTFSFGSLHETGSQVSDIGLLVLWF